LAFKEHTYGKYLLDTNETRDNIVKLESKIK